MKPLIYPQSRIELVADLFKGELDRIIGTAGGWSVDKDNRGAMNALCAWMAAGDLRRGPRLSGPVGTGKSSLISACSGVLLKLHGVGIRTVDAVELSVAVSSSKDKRGVLKSYADFHQYPFLVIEDLTLEKNAPSYVKGDNGINVVAELIQLRYKYWQQGLPLSTGFTDNADDQMLEHKYELRCCSRMGHMAFLVAVPGNDRRVNAPLPVPAAQLSIAFSAAAEPLPEPEEQEATAPAPAPAARKVMDNIKRLRDSLSVPDDIKKQSA